MLAIFASHMQNINRRTRTVYVYVCVTQTYINVFIFAYIIPASPLCPLFSLWPDNDVEGGANGSLAQKQYFMPFKTLKQFFSIFFHVSMYECVRSVGSGVGAGG